ncbi:MAG: T9SS type A sorting domain-containing protein [Ignavibacteria bacterium]|nr:T9SS type A sorting domain-containing protein [Ignavibacteria bacterium]
MKTTFIFLLIVIFICISFGASYSQQESVYKNNIIWKSNNTQDPSDMSKMPEARTPTQEEIDLLNEIQRLRNLNDPNQKIKCADLEKRLDELNTKIERAPGIIPTGSGVEEAKYQNPPFIQDNIGNTEIRNTGTKLVSGIATATEQRGTTAGRIWVALAWRTASAQDTIRLYYSTDNGIKWVWYGVGWLGGTNRINYDQMDMEIIENTTGEKYIWIVYGYRETAGTGRWKTGGVIFRTPTFTGAFFTLSWPGDDASKRYYGPRITSDNNLYPANPYVFIIASFDSSITTGKHNSQRIVRCTDPFTTTPTFSYLGGDFGSYANTTDNNLRDLHSDIAFFRNGLDSLIVSYSNMRDSTKLFFWKTNTALNSWRSAATFIGGNQPTHHKQYAVLASNSNDNGRIVCAYRQNDSPWRISYLRTTNWGNFNEATYGGPLGSAYNQNYQPEIVGVRGSITSYLTFNTIAATDSLQYYRIANGNTRLSGRMNSVTSMSGIIGSKPGFRFVSADTCFAIYCPTGPYDVWAASGCSGALINIKELGVPVQYALHQNYPNPFNPVTSIKFDIPINGFVNLEVYDVLGKKVATIINEVKTAGSYRVDFNATDLTSGIYFYRITSGDYTEIRKMILMK